MGEMKRMTSTLTPTLLMFVLILLQSVHVSSYSIRSTDTWDYTGKLCNPYQVVWMTRCNVCQCISEKEMCTKRTCDGMREKQDELVRVPGFLLKRGIDEAKPAEYDRLRRLTEKSGHGGVFGPFSQQQYTHQSK